MSMHVVLVHGAGSNPAAWSAVTPLLADRGIRYSVVDHSSHSIDGDAARVTEAVDAVGEPSLLVGHSYGGVVITNAGRHERVRGLVYVAAFAPAAGESVAAISADLYADKPRADDFWRRGPEDEWFIPSTPSARAALAWDVPDDAWRAEAEGQRRAADAIFAGRTAEPAWLTTPAWYLVATRDQHIPASAQRMMAHRADAVVSEVDTSHWVPQAAPRAVLAAIERAIAALC